jgi:hypothetical protein
MTTSIPLRIKFDVPGCLKLCLRPALPRYVLAKACANETHNNPNVAEQLVTIQAKADVTMLSKQSKPAKILYHLRGEISMGIFISGEVGAGRRSAILQAVKGDGFI